VLTDKPSGPEGQELRVGFTIYGRHFLVSIEYGMEDSTVVIPAAELAAKSKAHLPKKSLNNAKLASILCRKRPSIGGTSTFIGIVMRQG
jgi:hypothetical protein